MNTPLAGESGHDRSAAGGTILLVEDETDLRCLITRLLQSCGFTVLPAASGIAALQLWEEAKDEIQLVLTDIVMPGLTGSKLAELLTNERPKLKIIFTTGHASEFVGNGAGLVEGVNFLQIPYAVMKLLQTVRARLDSLD